MLYLKKFFLPRLRCSKHFHYIFFVKIPLAVGLAEPCDTWISRLRSPSCGYNISPQQRQNINNNFFSSDQIAFNMFSVNSEKLRNEHICEKLLVLSLSTFCNILFFQVFANKFSRHFRIPIFWKVFFFENLCVILFYFHGAGHIPADSGQFANQIIRTVCQQGKFTLVHSVIQWNLSKHYYFSEALKWLIDVNY